MIDLYERSILGTKQAQQRVLERGDVGEQEDEIAPAIYIQVFFTEDCYCISISISSYLFLPICLSLAFSLFYIYRNLSFFKI